jgi:hypothetical protein
MGGLFGGSKPPPLPEPKPAPPMPDDKSPEVLEAKRRAAADILSRAGRTSTILTAPGQRSSSADYSRTTLGGA